MNKRPIKDHTPKRASRHSVTAQLGGERKVPVETVVLDTVSDDGTKVVFRNKRGKRYALRSSAGSKEVVWMTRPQISEFHVVKEPNKIVKFYGEKIISQGSAGKPVASPFEKLEDPHLTLLAGQAFDTLSEVLDRPPAPSKGAKQAVARARLWRS